MLVNLNEENQFDSGKTGNKGKNLILLKKFGFNVPDGVIIDTDFYDKAMEAAGLTDRINELLFLLKEDNGREISQEINDLFCGAHLADELFDELSPFIDSGKEYAVRSSGTLEDCENHSFAGLYRTHLKQKGLEEIKEAVKDCWLSLFSEPILQYLYHNRIPLSQLKMAVILQEMVDADYSGIAFTVNPVTGKDREIITEISYGVGEDLVGGKVRPENYSYDWYYERSSYDEENKILHEEGLISISNIFLDIQKAFGYPCDIEFALKGGELFILQARAVTKIGYSEIKDMWSTADFRDGGVSAKTCIPYMWSLYEYIWQHALSSFVIDSKILPSSQCQGVLGDIFFGRPYWNLSFVKKAMSVIPGYKEREFDASYGVTPNYEGDGKVTRVTVKSLIRVLRIFTAQRKLLKEREENAEGYKELLLEKYRYYRATFDENLDSVDFEKKWYELTHDHYLKSENTYFRQIFINEIYQTLYRDKITKYVSYADYLKLMNGITDISHLRPAAFISDVSKEIRADEEAYQYWKTSSSDQIRQDLASGIHFLHRVSAFLEEYGYHSVRELDVSYPCYYEDVETVIAMFKDGVLNQGLQEESDTAQKQHQLYEMCLETLEKESGKKKFKNLKAQTEKIRKMLWWREEFRDLSTMLYYIIRIYTLRLGELYAEQGILPSKEDIWMTRVGDIWDFQDEKIGKEEFQHRFSKNKAYYLSFRNFLSENEIGSEFKPVQRNRGDGKTLYGTGCNLGTVSGTARVIDSIDEIDRLQKDDILVTKYTDTGWSPKFALLSGIVTEFGGVLCHGAIVAREYGIPCISSVPDATKKIKDGATIRIDGETGEISLFD